MADDHLRRAGETFLDSDGGGRTADERANAVRLLGMHNPPPPRGKPKHDDSDDDEPLLDDPPPAKPPPPPSQPKLSGELSAARKQDALPVIPPKPQPPRDRLQASKLRVAAARPKQAVAVAAPLPDNDDDDDDDDGGDVWAENHQKAVDTAPPAAAQPSTQRQQGGLSTFTFPDSPGEALDRYDVCMTYMMGMMCELTQNNIHAEIARGSLELFRSQMLACMKLEESADWEKLASYMVLYVETFRMLINSTADRVKADKKQQASRLAQSQSVPITTSRPPATVEQPPASKARPQPVATTKETSQAGKRTSARAENAIPPPIPTDADVPDGRVAQRSALPPGTHLNPGSVDTKKQETTPSYIAQAEEVPEKKNDDGCSVQ